MFGFSFARNVVLFLFLRGVKPVTVLSFKRFPVVAQLHYQFHRRAAFKSNKMLITEYESNIFSPQSRGQIQVIFGPMFSGKTTELIRRMRRYEIAKHSCLIVKYANDVRYDVENVATHDRQCREAISATTLTDLKQMAANYSVIGIDEGQFFPDTVSFAEEMANDGKIVIVAALDGTFQRKAFGDILQLVPLAESVIKLTAVCMFCFDEASFTKRIGTETQIEVIGGTDKYMAVCRNCYNIDSHTSATPKKIEDKIELTKENGHSHT